MNGGMKNKPDEFDEYLRQGEPQKRGRAEAWASPSVCISNQRTSARQVLHKYPTSLTVKGSAFVRSAE